MSFLSAPNVYATTDEALKNAASLSGNFLSGRVAYLLSDIEKSAFYFENALSDDPENKRLIERAFALNLADGQFEKAANLAQKLLTDEPDNSLANIFLMVKALKERRYNTVYKHLDLKEKPPIIQLTTDILRSWTLIAEGKYDEAKQLFEDPDTFPSKQVFYHHYGLIAGLAGRQEDAMSAIENAYQANNSEIRITETYARALARSGQKDKALEVIKFFHDNIMFHPRMVTLRESIAADEVPDHLIRSPQAGAAELFYGIATYMVQNRRIENAAQYLNLAIFLVPDFSVALNELANLHESLDQFEAAIEQYKLIPPEDPLYETAQIRISLCLNSLDDKEGAITHLEALLEKDPESFAIAEALGTIQRLSEKYEDAAKTYTQAVENLDEIKPEYWTIFYHRGISYERQKKWDAAEADFRKALELSPDHPQVLNYLGYSWIDMGLHYEEALTMIQKAVDQSPGDGYIIDSLGWAYYKLGRYKEAVDELERAVLLKPSSSILNDHLGDAYFKVGRKREAVYQWQHAMDLDPEENDLSLIKKKLETKTLIEQLSDDKNDT